MEEKTLQTSAVAAELQIIQAKSAAEFALTPIGQQVKQFEVLQRMAKMYSSSSIVPQNYQGENNLGNCVIAIDMAMRMNANPLMVMQNLTIVKGNPTWSSKFLIATINACGKFTPLRYEMVGKEGTDTYGCRCFAYEITDKDRKNPMYGTLITMKMAKEEQWSTKAGSKWLTMPEQMLKYRAAAFWQRIYAPEIGMGFLTQEEAYDIDDQTPKGISVEQEIERNANRETIGFVDVERKDVDAERKKAVVVENPVEPANETPSFMQMQ